MFADIIVIGIVVLCIIQGYKAGFFKSLVNIASYVISIILGFLLRPILAGLLMQTPLYTFFVEKINEKYPTVESLQGEWKFLEKYVDGAEGAFSEIVAGLLISIIAFVIAVIVCKIAIGIIAKALNLFTRLPVLKQFNSLGGAVAGGIIGIVVAYVAMALMVTCAPIESFDEVTNEIQDSTFAKEMYNNNIILNLLSGEE